MEIQDYLKIRDKSKLSRDDLESLLDDYLTIPEHYIRSYLCKFYNSLSHFIFWQEEFSRKYIYGHLEIILNFPKLINQEIESWIENKEEYEFLKIDKIIDETFDIYNDALDDSNPYSHSMDNLKYLFKSDNLYEEVKKLCRTQFAKEYLKEGELS